MSQPLQELINSLNSDNPQLAASAAESLAQATESIQSAAVPLCVATSAENESLCEWSSSALETLGKPHQDDHSALADLVQLYLQGKAQAPTAYWALVLLARAGESASHELKTVIRAAEHATDSSVKEKAVLCLGTLGPAAQAALPILNRLAADDSPRLARLARASLDQLKS